MADNQIDTGELMDCLVQNKHQKEMNEKCAVGVTHFQLVSVPKMNKWGKESAGVFQPHDSRSSTHLCVCPQIQIKDFRFSYKFKTACKEDVLKLCPNIKKK